MVDLHSAIVNATHALVVVIDSGARIVEFNPACERVTGYRFQEVQGRPYWDFLLPNEQIAGARATFEKLKTAQLPDIDENYLITKSGERRLVEWSNAAVTDGHGRVVQIVATGIDVTERRAAAKALRESEYRQRALLDSIPDATWLKNEKGVFLEVNRVAAERCGRDRSQVIGKTAGDMMPAAVAEQWNREEQEVMGARKVLSGETCRTVDGELRWFETVVAPVIGEMGDVIGTAGVSRDVTEARKAKQLVRDAQQREKALLDSIPDCAWLKDREGRYIAANKAFCRKWAVDREDVAGKTDFDLLPGAFATQFIAEDRAVLAEGEPRRFEQQILLDGCGRWIEKIKVPIRNESGDIIGIAGISRDVTERKLAEAQRLTRDATLRAALMREVHHRIKNNLQGVIGLMQSLASAHPDAAGLLDAVVSRVNAIASMHGLHGATGEHELRLEQIIRRLVSSLEVLYADLPLHLSVRGGLANAQVAADEIVPLALTVNELIMNAIKHSRSAADSGPVEIALEGAADCARIAICNRTGQLPQQFDFDTGAGLGTGLSLVKSLLPPAGALLRFENRAGPAGVQVELTLRPPVIASSVSGP